MTDSAAAHLKYPVVRILVYFGVGLRIFFVETFFLWGQLVFLGSGFWAFIREGFAFYVRS